LDEFGRIFIKVLSNQYFHSFIFRIKNDEGCPKRAAGGFAGISVSGAIYLILYPISDQFAFNFSAFTFEPSALSFHL
jgi:hypothetical protein